MVIAIVSGCFLILGTLGVFSFFSIKRSMNKVKKSAKRATNDQIGFLLREHLVTPPIGCKWLVERKFIDEKIDRGSITLDYFKREAICIYLLDLVNTDKKFGHRVYLNNDNKYYELGTIEQGIKTAVANNLAEYTAYKEETSEAPWEGIY